MLAVKKILDCKVSAFLIGEIIHASLQIGNSILFLIRVDTSLKRSSNEELSLSVYAQFCVSTEFCYSPMLEWWLAHTLPLLPLDSLSTALHTRTHAALCAPGAHAPRTM